MKDYKIVKKSVNDSLAYAKAALLVPFFVISNVGTINGPMTMLERSLTLEEIRLDFRYAEFC
ncbi:MAG: hypothetical protein JJV89_03345 [Desulfosarcina sp.]|nr:hypothetical protein [Desulfobacterales bacterium]